MPTKLGTMIRSCSRSIHTAVAFGFSIGAGRTSSARSRSSTVAPDGHNVPTSCVSSSFHQFMDPRPAVDVGSRVTSPVAVSKVNSQTPLISLNWAATTTDRPSARNSEPTGLVTDPCAIPLERSNVWVQIGRCVVASRKSTVPAVPNVT